MTNTSFIAVERVTISVQVANRIRAAILDRSLAAGEQLPPERTLASQFGVSRATIREALRRVQAEGLLAPIGRTSPMQTATTEGATDRFRESLANVVRLQKVSLPDLLELRLAIETAALVRACETPVKPKLAEARRQLATMSEPRLKRAAFHQADRAFHVALVAASGNAAHELAMLAVTDSIELQLDEARRARSFKAARPRLVADHKALLAAIERGSKTSTVRLLRKHVAGSYGT